MSNAYYTVRAIKRIRHDNTDRVPGDSTSQDFVVDQATRDYLLSLGVVNVIATAPAPMALRPSSEFQVLMQDDQIIGLQRPSTGAIAPLNDQGEGRMDVVFFGNSLIKNQATYDLSSVTTAIVGATAPVDPGTPYTFPVSATTLAINDIVRAMCYDGSMYESTVTALPANGVTVSAGPTKAIPNGELLLKKYASTYSLRFASNAYLRALNAKLGNPWNIVNCYGYGGALSTQMDPDFQANVIAFRPKAAIIVAAENDVNAIAGVPINGQTLTFQQVQAQYISWIKQCAAIRCKVVMTTPLPSYGFNTPATCQAYDNLVAWMETLPNQFPNVEVWPAHLAWIDQSITTARQPQGTPSGGVSTWTDSILHPHAKGSEYLSNFLVPYAQKTFPFLQAFVHPWPPSMQANGTYSANATMSGSSGSVQNFVTGQCPTNTQTQATATGVTTATATSALIPDGQQQAWEVYTTHVNGSDGPANLTDMRLLPVTCAPGTKVCGRAEVELKDYQALHGYELVLDFGNGQSLMSYSWNTTDVPADTVGPSGRIVLETASGPVPSFCSTARLYFRAKPKSVASGANYACRQRWFKSDIAQLS